MYSISQARKKNYQLVSITMTVTKPSAIHTICSTKGKPSMPEYVAHFARKRAHTLVGLYDNDHDKKNKRHLRAAPPRASHPGPNMWYVSVARRHNNQLVRLIKIITTKSLGILTSCRSKSEPFQAPICGTFRARQSTVVSWSW
jgi:hypothetical protein